MTTLFQPRTALLAIAIASIALIAGALFFQFVVKLTPCELCLYQRWPYYIAIVVSLAAFAVGKDGLGRLVIGLCAVLFLIGAALAFYHVGVEQHWFPGPTACTGPAMNAGSLEALKAQIMGQPPVRCDQIQWSLFGISLAGYNLAASLILAGFCVTAVRRASHGRQA